MYLCLGRSETSLIGLFRTSSTSISWFYVLFFVSITFSSTGASENNTGTTWISISKFPSLLLSQIISPSYIVNISVCGAFDIQNNTHWFTPCNLSVLNHSDCHTCKSKQSNQSLLSNCSTCFTHLSSCFLHTYTGHHINNTRLLLETYLAVPLLTHLLSYKFATTASFLDFAFFAGLSITAYRYVSPAILFFLPLALIFSAIFIKKLVVNCMALRFAWTRHTNFIIDDRGRLFVNHDDVLISDPQGLRVGPHKVRAAKVILGGREANLLRQAHVEEWSW
uniref:GP5 protein n=1 Tax=Simian hemorrhagic fever virus TaxID=38143 RepID=A0A077EKM7_SHFV|nr:GP5 protein [Simian hemorrhagic fever virus]AIL48105.1 GP5 protein [Simian hemorrhagic fever virus]AIL48135.1 GP5 protein [Simian hemorrhagic fever virus]